MRPSYLLGGLSLVLMLVGSTGAEHCTTWSTSRPEITTTGDEGAVHYIDNDLCQFECGFSIWIYEESNDIPGLQRGDERVDDTCHGMISSDTLPCQLLPMALLTPGRPKARKGAASAAIAGALIVGVVATLPTAEAC